jgi:hypothetical protein
MIALKFKNYCNFMNNTMKKTKNLNIISSTFIKLYIIFRITICILLNFSKSFITD